MFAVCLRLHLELNWLIDLSVKKAYDFSLADVISKENLSIDYIRDSFWIDEWLIIFALALKIENKTLMWCEAPQLQCSSFMIQHAANLF